MLAIIVSYLTLDDLLFHKKFKISFFNLSSTYGGVYNILNKCVNCDNIKDFIITMRPFHAKLRCFQI